MKKSKQKIAKQSNRYGVFNGSELNSDTISNDTEVVIEPYNDESITITKIKDHKSKKAKSLALQAKSNKFARQLIYKIIATIIIAISFIGAIIYLSLSV